MNMAAAEAGASAGEGVSPPSVFEWLLPPAAFVSALEECGLALPGCGARCVVVGCGTSGLSCALRGRCAEVVSLDCDAQQVAFMRAQHAGEAGVAAAFRVCDVCDVVAAAAVVGAAPVDLVLDKCTLDCLLCSNRALLFVQGVRRMLRDGGRYVIASCHGEATLRRYFGACPGWEWESLASLPRAVGDTTQLLVLRKRGGSAADADCFRGDPAPLLDAAREGAIRQRWGAQVASGAGLPLAAALACLFPAAAATGEGEGGGGAHHMEYCLADFEGDLAEHLHLAALPESITLGAALAFVSAVE